MKKYLSALLIGLMLLTNVYGQDFSLNVGAGFVYPIERSFVFVDLCNQIAQNYSLALSTEISQIETNLSPQLNVLYKDIDFKFGFGWGY